MSIAMFAIIGATINAGVGYWICFSVFCVIKAVKLVCDIVKVANE